MNKFITLEGCEGSGKTTQRNNLEKYLIENNIKHYFTREPGGTTISEKIREIILDSNNKTMTASCEALLYSASRVQLIEEQILPKLNEGYLVICDRYIDSSLAYQAYARGLGLDFVKSINIKAFELAMPSVTFFFDIDPSTAFNRKGGADKGDRIEESGIAFHKKVYNGYKELALMYSDRFVSIDGTKNVNDITKELIFSLKTKGVI